MIQRSVSLIGMACGCLFVASLSVVEARFRQKSYTFGLRFGDPYAQHSYGSDEEVSMEPLVAIEALDDDGDVVDEVDVLPRRRDDDEKRSPLSHMAVIESCSGYGQPCARNRMSALLGARACCPGFICASRSFSMLSGHAVCQPDIRII